MAAASSWVSDFGVELAGIALRNLVEHRLDVGRGGDIGLDLRLGERDLLHRLVGRGGGLVLGQSGVGREQRRQRRQAAEREGGGERANETGHRNSSRLRRGTLPRRRPPRKPQPFCASGVCGGRATARGAKALVSAKIAASVTA